MINLSSLPAQIVQEITEDYPHVEYWAKRKRPDLNKWINDTQATQEPQILLGNETVTKNGNRWMTFYVQDKSINGQAVTAMVSFIYYETIGSLGVFAPVNRQNNTNTMTCGGCLIFTSHFFQRLTERTGADYGSRKMLMDFVLSISTFTLYPAETDEHGQKKIMIQLAGGMGKGISIQDEPLIAEIRTYLHETQLNPKQQKELQRCRDKQAEKPIGEELLQEIIDTCRHIFHAAGYVPLHDLLFWERCKNQCASYFLEATRMYNCHSYESFELTYKQLAAGIARVMQIRHYDPKRIERVLYEIEQGSIDQLQTDKRTNLPDLMNLVNQGSPFRKR